MIVEINKDIEKYKESVVLGLTAKQLFAAVGAVVVGAGIVFLVYPYIGLTGSAYVAIPAVAPIALSGFYSFNGMSFMEMLKRRARFLFDNKPLVYRSTEGDAVTDSEEVRKAVKLAQRTGNELMERRKYRTKGDKKA